MHPIVTTCAADKVVIVAAIPEGRCHLQVGQPPVAIVIIQVGLAILQENP
jgi:hypothetical protein